MSAKTVKLYLNIIFKPIKRKKNFQIECGMKGTTLKKWKLILRNRRNKVSKYKDKEKRG